MERKPRVILVSACLLGVHTKYNGGHNENRVVLQLAADIALLPVCPEQLGGLPTPRPASEIQGGDGVDVLRGNSRVVDACGEDKTDAFLRGSRETWHLARVCGAGAALLKAGSPSCGCGEIHDGSFTGQKKAGVGVTAGLLAEKGLAVFTEDQIDELKVWLEAGDS
jgi:uncharacterized protein YbbK (DUF523 family)